MANIVAEFNRYSPHRLTVTDPYVAILGAGGSFRAGGDGEAAVRLLESNFGIDAERRGNETILRKRQQIYFSLASSFIIDIGLVVVSQLRDYACRI